MADIAMSDVKTADAVVVEVVVSETTVVVENEDIKKLISVVVDDPEFVKRMEAYIKDVLQDGKVDVQDVPELTVMIMDIYNSVDTSKLLDKDQLSTELPEFLKTVFDIITSKHNLIPDDKKEMMDKMIISTIKLAIVVPKFKESCCFSFVSDLQIFKDLKKKLNL